MVRLTVFVRRKPGMTPEEFAHHWHHHHGPLIAGLPSLAARLVRYEQHGRAAVPAWAGTEGYDGMAVQWFRSFADFEGFLADPAYAEHVAPDEDRFLDRAGVLWLFTHEEPVVVIDGDPAAPAVEATGA